MHALSLRTRAVALGFALLLPHAARAQAQSSTAYTVGRLIGYGVLALLVIVIVQKLTKKK